MALTAVDLTPRIGSEIKVDVETLLSGGVAGEIRDLLVERGVLIARGLDLTDDQQRALPSRPPRSAPRTCRPIPWVRRCRW